MQKTSYARVNPSSCPPRPTSAKIEQKKKKEKREGKANRTSAIPRCPGEPGVTVSHSRPRTTSPASEEDEVGGRRGSVYPPTGVGSRPTGDPSIHPSCPFSHHGSGSIGGFSSAEGFFLSSSPFLMFLLHCSETNSERHHIPLQTSLLQILHFARPFSHKSSPLPGTIFLPFSRLRTKTRAMTRPGPREKKRLLGRRGSLPHPLPKTKGVERPIRWRRRHRIRRHLQTLRVRN
ncbi:hypothetical protein CGRA01v4_09906 [Colletotrichum graminicola]|nr:hypothetical protein CGRA01v4_09906 [Colletotrichum graminicola]